ncbi:serine protease [Sulfolobales archaeon HS-7]|nr:serine protease [Sulfolobales archaeon HS-7]
MVAHIVIPIIVIAVVIALLILTGYYADPLIDIPSLAIVGFFSYRMFYVISKTRKRNIYKYEGLEGIAVDDIKRGEEGYVRVNGELWKAISTEDISRGERIEVVSRQGMTLIVKKRQKEVAN